MGLLVIGFYAPEFLDESEHGTALKYQISSIIMDTVTSETLIAVLMNHSTLSS